MINIVGAGLAGLSAALTLAERGIKCRLISAQPSERAQSVLAEGGINAALDTMGEGDTAELHFEETMKGGAFLADPNAVQSLTSGAPGVVMKLASLGVPFSRNGDGSLMLRSFGGQKKKRTAFAQSSTGKMIMTALIDEVRKYEEKRLVARFPHHTFVRLLTGNCGCTGVRIKDEFTGRLYDCGGSVIAALGGLNGFFPSVTTGTVTNSGSPAAVMFVQGVKFANLEMIQYHPTSIAIPGKRCLVSEAARGEGGRLFSELDGSRSYFMEERYPTLKNLMPRDVISREMFFEKRAGRETYLDMTGLSGEVWENRLSDLRSEIMSYLPIDPKNVPVQVAPAIHYFMGGIYVNERHGTCMSGLYAAGECACIYHGANRLGGNSMLGAVFGGMKAAESAAVQQTDDAFEEYTGSDEFACCAAPGLVRRTGELLLGGLGIVRNAETVEAALAGTERLDCGNAVDEARKKLASAMLASALARKESRGAHYREDFPEPDDEYRKTTVCALSGGKTEITFEEIPERRQK